MKPKNPVQKIEQTPLEKAIEKEQQGRAKQVETKIAEYEQLISSLPDLLLGYGIQVKELCKAVDMARGTFYNRVKRREFAPADLRKVYKYIESHPKTCIIAPETRETTQNTQYPSPTPEKTPEGLKMPIDDVTATETAEPEQKQKKLEPINWDRINKKNK